MFVQFLIVIVAVNVTLTYSEPQLSSIFKPLLDLRDTLTGTSGEQQNNRPQSNYQSRPAYFSPSRPQVSNYQPSTSVACNDFWSYQYDRENYGLLTIPHPNYSKNDLRIVLSLATQLQTTDYGEVSLLRDKETAARDIANGQPILYRIRFPIQNPLPKPTSVYLNDQLICSSPKDVSKQYTTITLYHTFYTSLPNSNLPPRPAHRPPPTYQVTDPPTYATRRTNYYNPPVTQSTTFSMTNDNRFGSLECGIPSYKAPQATGLIVGGHQASRGQFPWLAAYYHNGKGDESGFICGGSLISTRIIITAAHCVHTKKEAYKRRAEDAYFYIGKNNIGSNNDDEKNFVHSGVSQLIVHPDWNYNDDSYDADISLAILVKTVEFNKFVKPICLWTMTDSYNDWTGKSGIVAGWGKTEFAAISTDNPKWTYVYVVDTLTCIRSNNAFNALTSDRTFCGGTKNGNTGPCNGDSGGGFVVQSKTDNKWYLRGVVSSALIDSVKQICDVKNYAVFTDTTKFTSWIQGYVQNYG